jgi:N-acetylglucosaminyl-diphospho-decaprenol L-rhamnosyltransferase
VHQQSSVSVSISIVHYETPDLLRLCLAAIRDSEGAESWEVRVVDNGSRGFDSQAIASILPNVVVIQNRDNRGFAVASNQGLRGAGGRYLLLLNPDAIVEPQAIARVVDYLDGHEDVGCATARLVLPDGRLDLACRRSFPTPAVAFFRMTLLSRVFPRSHRFGRYNLTYLPDTDESEIDAPCGAFMMVRSSVADHVGLLDESYFMYGEDLDWAFRIKAAGWRVMYLPSAVVHHVKRASSSRNPEQSIRWFHEAMRHFYNDHYRREYPRGVSYAVMIAIVLRERIELTWSTISRAIR